MLDAPANKHDANKNNDETAERLREDSRHSKHAPNADGEPKKDATKPGNASNDDLHAKGLLPKFEVTAPPKKWTVAIELGATLPGGKDYPDGFGAENKLKQLQSLAKSTEGKSVNLLVEVERTADKKGDACHKPGSTAGGAEKCDDAADKKGLLKTERYFIHDGKIDKLPDSKAKSASGEIQELVHDAAALSGGGKLGLIIQSHGLGHDGIHANRGDVSNDKVADAIKQGLKGSDRKQLDVLDFDACSMGNLSVMDKMSKVAAHVVASESEEGAGSKSGARVNDGQNVVSTVRGLLGNDNQTPSDFAASLVQHAKDGENGVGKADATLTLTHFDMSKYKDFKDGLDQFGAQLAKASGDVKNRAAIKSSIDGSTDPQTGPDKLQAHERDLKSFTENILSKIHSGELKTKDDSLEKSATKFLSSLSSFTPNNFGEKDPGLDKLGGLTTSMPGSEVLDRKTIGRLASPIHKVSSDLEKLDREGLTIGDKKPAVDTLKQSIDDMHNELRGLPGEPSKILYASLHKIEEAKTEAEFHSRLKEFADTVRQAENSKVGRSLAHGSENAAVPLYKDYLHSRSTGIAPAWDRFIDNLEKSRD